MSRTFAPSALPILSESDALFDKMHEECGVIGVWRAESESAAALAHRGLFALQHRGQEAAGIASWTDRMHRLRGRGLVAEALPVFKVKNLPGHLAIGHVRYSTVPADQSQNVQPFSAHTPYGSFAIAHNGNLKNAEELRASLEKRGTLLSTTMDTELFVHLMAQSGRETIEGALKAAANQVEGAYSLTMICEGRLMALRDRHGVRPLVLGYLEDGGVVIASESSALEALGAKMDREIEPGELVIVDAEGVRSQKLLTPADPNPCVFELVYFARPNSTVFGQSAYQARIRMGEALAEQDIQQDMKPDIVVPVPDSGTPAAIGYARKSGLPLEQAIIRSHYIGRTFILPDQDSRTHSLKLKLSVIKDVVAGKRVALLDDSIVRGNTSRILVEMVREAGAAEVWMRIASPALGWPCYLGINTPSKDELIANRYEGEVGIGEAIGVDSLRYLSLDGLKEATQRQPFCFGCMTGDYPV